MHRNLDRFSAILAAVAGYSSDLNIEEMVESLKNTSKRNLKVDLLAQYLTDPKIKNLVKRCYNPFERFFISKVKTDQSGYFNIKDIYSDVNAALDELSSRNITGKAAKALVESILAQLKPDSQKVFINILNKDLKCGIGIESINAACPGLVEQFNVQLANKWTRDKDYKVKFWYGSHKFDGIRCMYQNKYPGIMHTREGSELVGFDHIVRDLKTLVDRMKDCPEFMGSGEKELFVDGELFSDNLSFNEIQGIVLSTKNVDVNKKKLIYLKVFALGPVKNTSDMVKFFEDPKIFQGLSNIKPISYFKVNNDPDEISRKTREFVDQGYEGLMLRHPEQAYDWKRTLPVYRRR